MDKLIPGTKIFGIGLNKTGTTTLGMCGKLLGYRCKSCNKELLEDVKLRDDFTRVKEVVSQNDLFEDWPWPLIYKELDQMFPGSKFILTVRKDEETWLKSLKKYSLGTRPVNHYRKLTYGYDYPEGHEQEHIDFYQRHNNEVRTYFEGRENDLLEICWEHGHGWEELCTFLGREVPDMPFPHANKGSSAKKFNNRRIILNRILKMIKT